MAEPQNIIQDAIDRDVASGKLVPITNSTHDRRTVARSQGTYDVYIEIDCDCQELLDATGTDYNLSGVDDTQNEVKVILDYDEFTDVFEQAPLCLTNEQTLATALLNPELGEYTTKVTVYLPSGDKITFE